MTVMLHNNASINISDDEGALVTKDESLRFSQSNFLHHHKIDESIEVHYTLGELLGEGGFGVVYRGTHKKTGAQRAIKKMERDPLDKELNEEVIQEFEFLKELDHPNLIKVYDMFEAKVEFHIVTDLYGGGDLIDYLEECDHLPETNVQVFMNRLLSCIEYLHDSRHMVHRDLKLENVLLDTDKNLADMKLIDFGLARHFTREDTFYELVGSTSYVAPQVIEGSYTAKCDIWSCGVIAFCLLSGYTPFEGYDDGQTIQAILVGRIDFDDPVWDSISDEAKDFICNLLAYEEAERPTAQQALDHPWLSGYRAAELDESTGDMDTSLRESLRGLQRFTSRGCKLKQAACAIMASQLLQKEEKESINADFQFLNRSLGGAITRKDLQQSLYDVQMDDSDEVVDNILEQVNFSGSGAISYSEFTIAMMFERDMVDENKLRLIFNLLDSDGDAAISAKDLQEALQMSEDLSAKMLEPLKCNANGALSFEQFSQAIMANETMDGSNFLDSSYRMDEFSARRKLDSSIGDIPDTVSEGNEDLPDESAHTQAGAEPVEEPEAELPAPEEPAPEPEPEPEPVQEPEPEPEPEPEEPAAPAEPEGLSEERMRLCFHWYMRFGHPDKKTMLRRVTKMGDECPLTEEDVEALPWACGGAIIPVKEINKINQTNVNADGDITNKRSSLRASAAKTNPVAAAAATVASEIHLSDTDNDTDDDRESKEAETKPIEKKRESIELSQAVVQEEVVKEEETEADLSKPAFSTPSEFKAHNRHVVPPSPKKEVAKPKITGTRTRALSNKKPVQVSSVLAGGENNALTTKMVIEAAHSETGQTETILTTRQAMPRKEMTIFSGKKAARDFDWKTVEKKTLKVASPEERKTIKQDFKWNCIAKKTRDGKGLDMSETDGSRMSRSEPGTCQRRSGSLIWTPSAKSAESQMMVFPKNRRRSSHTATTDKARRQSNNKRRVTSAN